ncbi:ArsR family transcriptional regulator [Mesocricetibacter intestinalis]|uniref:ArsR family transcriptional regulator n=1 Tax=Mesocricetibacter intestinalis TaxID=1521930 RepID=A0A4R6VBJ0_9PAST|nr:metalloregulator ArsR/SmtB family transcription factor [Mesocricetibacter intestinalis]TDQ57438.1 ArsR family transcriptional regulator [Mesocricetibacter intestinalis]
MNTESASKLFESLSSPIRLKIFQHLTLQGHQGMVAGELAKQLGLAPNNLSFHLKTLLAANLIYSRQEGRFIRYYANLPLMMKLVSFLTARCCQNEAGDTDCKKFCGD